MNDLHDMMAAYAQGSLSAQQVAELEAYLREDRDRARAWVYQAMLDCHLTELMHEQNLQQVAADLSDDSQFGMILKALEAPEGAAAMVHIADPGKRSRKPRPKHAQQDAEQITFHDLLSVAGYLTLKTLRSKAGTLTGIAAALVLALTLALVFTGNPTPQNQPNKPAASAQPTPRGSDPTTAPAVATLTATHNAQWAWPASAAPTTGTPLSPNQRLTLTAGFAEVTTARGAIAIIEAPATIELLDQDNALYLHTGKLVGICETESSKGFTVHTAALDITDLGTRFCVDAAAGGTEVHVYQGVVEVSASDASNPDVPITKRIGKGQALRINEGEPDLVAIDPDLQRFAAGLGYHQLPGTGYDVEHAGNTRPNWRVIEINGQPLDTPVQLRQGIPHAAINQTPNAPGIARWTQLEDADQQQAKKETIYTINTAFVLPDNIDLETAVLQIDFHADDSIVGVQFNGQPYLAWDQIEQTKNGKGTASIRLKDIRVKPGLNEVNFSVLNAPQTALFLYVDWAIQQTPGWTQPN